MADSLLDLGAVTDIFDIRPNWTSNPSETYEIGRQILQYNKAYASVRNMTPYNARMLQYNYLLSSKEDEYNLLDFFASHRGRLYKFWLPLYFQEFKLRRTAYAASFQISIENTHFSYVGLDYIDHIYIELKNGDRISRLITTNDSSPDFVIDLAINALDRTIYAEDIRYFGKLLLVRFDQDELSLSYITDIMSECSIKFRELPQEYESPAT